LDSCIVFYEFCFSIHPPPLQSVSELMARQLFLAFIIHVHISEHMFQDTTRGGEIPFKCTHIQYIFCSVLKKKFPIFLGAFTKVTNSKFSL
jgi:hypothetical protein